MVRVTWTYLEPMLHHPKSHETKFQFLLILIVSTSLFTGLEKIPIMYYQSKETRIINHWSHTKEQNQCGDGRSQKEPSSVDADPV